MELQNYSRQLMQQLHTLRKDGQFCDCTVLVGDAVHSAHKVVLAASSLLFKSLLDSSDSISIDATMVSSAEFSSLLDLAYMGRLAPGQHDFTRVIAAADSLQMFDVAVGCKNVLDGVMERTQDQGLGSAVPAGDARGLNEGSTDAPEPAQILKEDGSLDESSRSSEHQQNPVSKLTEFITSGHNIPKMLTRAADKCADQALKKVLLGCRGETSCREVLRRLVSTLSERETEETLVLLLEKMENSTADTKEAGDTSAVKHGSGSEEDEKQEEDEVKEQEMKEGTRRRRRRRSVLVSYTCQWCNKSFDFKCRLLKHRQKCAFSPDRTHRCTECSLAFSGAAALQEHSAQAHDAPPGKKKKPPPVQCDVCGKAFKHPSGLLYHKRTEHLEERPYSCKDCGAKFAANSSLKNHVRLHTGEKPYQCIHCDMRFAVAASLSYHTKKKHAEGKMFECQYCSATFAQSIELTRHVRTHTGDKPYVCRQCGKGFKQANGLSVHLQTFHSVSDPHDCQKCRVSFGSLENLREHIQEVHPKELHECPECSKIFSSGSQLDKHMSTHDGSKPYRCQSCNKSYQTLSGLWYHNRTIHPDLVKAGGGRTASRPLQGKVCGMTFCNRSSQFKHQLSKHPEMHVVTEGVDEKDTPADAHGWRCVYCPQVLGGEQELQQHVSREHVNQPGSSSTCAACALPFASEPELHQHYLSDHAQVIREELDVRDSSSQMVIQTGDTLAEGAVGPDQSHHDGSQVFVAGGDRQEVMSTPGVVTVNMEDLLAGGVALMCQENQ